jgi:antitoxin HicB
MANPRYPLTVRPLAAEDGGGWLAEFPDLPGCMADGDTPEEALREADDALRSWIKTAKAHGDRLPPPSRSALGDFSGRWLIRAPRSLHRRLAEYAKNEGGSLNSMTVTLLAAALPETMEALRKPGRGTSPARRQRPIRRTGT